jgi:N,N'-diacetylchitobiose phosphorylase
MKYGHFSDETREYIVERPDVPASWTNYLGLGDLCGIISHNAAGYGFHKTTPDGRFTRFRLNSLPMDRPGRYVYIRDDETGEYWSISWQPVGKDLTKAKYRCAHGLSYSRFECDYRGLLAKETVFIPLNDACEVWAVDILNKGKKQRKISVFSYQEFSFKRHEADVQSFLYASTNTYKNGVIRNSLINYHGIDARNIDYGASYFTATFTPDSYDIDRDAFIGDYRSESNPIAVEKGKCGNTAYNGGNACGCLHKKYVIPAGKNIRMAFLSSPIELTQNKIDLRKKYSDWKVVEKELGILRDTWEKKIQRQMIDTPDKGMNSSINIWNLYQTETCITWSRFASFVEYGSRFGLGYRDTSQDCMAVVHSHREKSCQRICELLSAQYAEGFCIHLFEPATQLPGTATGRPARIYSDDFMWMVITVCEYVKETGDMAFFDRIIPYADKGEATVYEHMRQGIHFVLKNTGKNGLALALFADWNDCLNLRNGGESGMVTFQLYWALNAFASAARRLGKNEDDATYTAYAEKLKKLANEKLWDGKWFARAITGKGDMVGSASNKEAKLFLNAQSWAVYTGVADAEKGKQSMDAVHKHLYSPWGIHLFWPAYSSTDLDVGFLSAYPKGLKENAGIFCHPNPWAVIAECVLGRGDQAYKLYSALLPYNQNDKIETRQAEPYAYCQFVVGRDHKLFGRARHPWLTGTAGWMYTAATKYVLGFRPDYDSFTVDPCIPKKWNGFNMRREFRDAVYNITVKNPRHVSKGIKEVSLNGIATSMPIRIQPAGSVNEVTVVMG